MTLGEKIQKLRKNADLSQEKFAEILNVSRQAVSKWEQNVSIPDINSLINISDIFYVSIDTLARDELSLEINTLSKKYDNGHKQWKAFIGKYFFKSYFIVLIVIGIIVIFNQFIRWLHLPFESWLWALSLGKGAPIHKLWNIYVVMIIIYIFLKSVYYKMTA